VRAEAEAELQRLLAERGLPIEKAQVSGGQRGDA